MQRYIVFGKCTASVTTETLTEGTPQISKICRSRGGNVIDAYLTLGSVDIVLVLEFPSNEACVAAMVEYGQLGLLTTQTMPAFPVSSAADLIG